MLENREKSEMLYRKVFFKSLFTTRTEKGHLIKGFDYYIAKGVSDKPLHLMLTRNVVCK